MLKASFVRRRGQRDRVYATRSDGSSTSWDFPSYGDELPHDVCHLVVEDALGLWSGFWGLIDQGAEVSPIRNESTLVRNGRSLAQTPGFDLSGLLHAEAAVAELAGPASADESALAGAGQWSSAGVAAVRRRLRELRAVWAELPDGTALDLTFGGSDRP